MDRSMASSAVTAALPRPVKTLATPEKHTMGGAATRRWAEIPARPVSGTVMLELS